MNETAALTTDTILAMSPESAGKALEEKAVAFRKASTPTPPTPSTAARVQIDALTRDGDFQAKLSAGNPEARKTFADLCAAVAAGDAASDAIAGGPELPADHIETTTGGQLSSNALRREAEGLSRAGFDRDVVRQMIDGTPVSAAEKEMAVRLRSMRLGDAAYVSRYLAGGAAEKLEMGLLATLIAAEVAA